MIRVLEVVCAFSVVRVRRSVAMRGRGWIRKGHLMVMGCEMDIIRDG